MPRIDHGRGTFVLFGRLRVPCHEKAPQMVVAIDYLAPYGIPVCMYVGDGHEDRKLQTALLQVLPLEDLFDDNHLTVGTGEYRIRVAPVFAPRGFAEKERHADAEPEEQNRHRPEEPYGHPGVLHGERHAHRNGRENRERTQNNGISLSGKSHWQGIYSVSPPLPAAEPQHAPLSGH